MAKKPKPPFHSVDRQILADSGTSGAAAENLYHLCDQIGTRFAGTDGYRAAAEYMLAQFKKYRLENVRLEPFEFVAWRRGGPAELTLTKPVSRTYPCYALPYGSATEANGIEAEVIDIGAGAPADIEANKKKMKRRIVLTTSAGGHRTDVLRHCRSHGAVGFLLAGRAQGMMLPTGTVADGEEAGIPAVGIAYESALELQRLMAEGKTKLRLVTEGFCEKATTWNVVGELPGTEFPDELVIMGGHLDSHDIGPGAFDNAAGAVQVMEAARLLAKQRKHLKRTVRFIGFAAEEVGLLGSHYHAKKHAKELRKARFMLNSDCPSMNRPKGLAFHRCPTAVPYIEQLAAEMQTPIPVSDRFHSHSDHYPFILQGLPTAGMGGGKFGAGIQNFVHMAADTPDKISTTDLREGAAFAAKILLRAASDERWPKMRRSRAQVKKLVDTLPK